MNATARAVDYNTKCKTMAASDKVGDYFPILDSSAPGAPTCYYFVKLGSSTHANAAMSIEYSQAMAATGYDYDLLVWNIDQV